MNYTSIEQSKKLLELGLSSESADMAWIDRPSRVTDCPDVPVIMDIELESIIPQNKLIACWSLGALLELMPEYIAGTYRDYYLEIYKDLDRWTVCYSDREGYHPYFTYSEDSENILKAAYNMIIWLLENGHISSKAPEDNKK